MAEIKIYGTLVNDTNEAIVKSTQVAAVKQDGTAATQSAVNADLYAKYAAVGNAYRVKGTKATIAEVTALTTKAIGDVWNVTAEFTLNSKKYPAGTNVVWTGSEWDPLGGTVDIAALEAKIPKSADVYYEADGANISVKNSSDSQLFNARIDVASSSLCGVMSTSDKSKLDGIEAGAQVNRVEMITIDGDDSFVNNPGTKILDISLKRGIMPIDIRFTNGKFYLSNDYKDDLYPTTVQFATKSVPGFMSYSDKTKLDYIAYGAQENVLEAVKVNGTALSVSGKSVNIDLSPYAKSADTIHVADVVATATDMNLKLRKAAGATPICNVTFNAATTSAAGLMSAADKQRLDGAASAKDLEATNLVIKSLGTRITALEEALTLK